MTEAIRVLYVDDETSLLDIGKLFLEESGDFTVTTTMSATEGIRLLEHEKFDAIISDYQMPGMDGIEFLVKVRTDIGQVPFILFTGKGREEIVIQAINSGADFYLQKGGESEAQFAELSHKIKKAVEGRRAEEDIRTSRDRLIRSEADLNIHKTELEAQAEELMRTHLALEESRDKYLDLYEFAPLGYLTLSDKALITDVNLTGVTLLGIERKKLLRAPFSKFMSEKDADEWHLYFRNVLDKKEKLTCTLMLTRADGSVFPARLESICISGNSAGTPTIRVAISDISDLRNMEDTLRESEEKFRSLAESSPDYIMRYDRQCRHTYMNPAGLCVSGLTEDKIIGKTHRETGFDENLSRFWEERITGVFETGKPCQTQFAWESAQGPVTLDWVLAPEFSDNGTVQSVLGVSRDITRLKKTEEALKQSEILLKKTGEIARVGGWKLDAETLEVTWTDETYHIHEVPVGRMPRLDGAINCFHPDERGKLSDAITRALTTGEGYDMELRFITATGKQLWTRSLCQPEVVDGRTIRLIGAFQDITEKKHTEEELLRKNEELQAAFEQIAAAEEELRGNLDELTRQEQALRESGEKFRTLFESAGDAILVMDRNVILDCNRKTEELYRLSRDPIIGHSPGEFSPERQPDGTFSAEKLKRKIDAAFQGENRFFEWIHIHQDGNPTIVEVSLNRFLVQDTWYLQAIVRDITDRKQNEEQTARLSELKEQLLGIHSLPEQLKLVSDRCVTIFGADFARIWLINNSDLCEKGCMHASVTAGPEVCHNRSGCLHLMVSSGRYTHTDGAHRRVPLGCYKIGRVASGEEPFFITNDVVRDPRVHDPAWAQSLGLVSFAGFRLLSQDNKPVGVLALFRNRPILLREEKLLVDLANTLSNVIVSGLAEEALRSKNEELQAAFEQIAAAEEELRGNLDELTRQEQELRESEIKYRTVIEQSLDGIFIAREGILVFFNTSLATMTGYRSDELAGRSIADLIAPEDRELVLSRHHDRLQGIISPDIYEFSVLHHDGTSRVPVKMMIASATFGGKPATIGTLHNMKEERNREEALRDSEERFRTIINSMQFGIVIIDAQTHTILEANPKALEMISGTIESVAGSVCHNFICPAASGNCPVTDKGQTIDSSERVLLNTRGEKIPILKNVIKTVLGGREVLIESFIDITGRKLAEDTLMRVNQKLNVLSQLTRQDLTTPIFVLNSYLEMAKKQAIGQDGIIKNIVSGERAVRSIKEITEFTKDYQNMGEKPPKWQNLKLAFLFGLSHISIWEIRHSLETENLEIFADPLLEKAFQGLLENSVKHGSHVSAIRVWHKVTPDCVTIIFEDDGIGVSPAKKEQIFFRGEGARASVRGLFFVQEILSITGITIRETGETGKGARFEMTVPKGAWRFSGVQKE